MISAGKYIGRARSETLCFGHSRSGSEQVAMNFEILNEGFEGQSVAWYGSLATEGRNGKKPAIEIAMRQLRDAGWTGDSLTDPTGLGSVEVDLDIKYETYQGKESMRVFVMPKDGYTVKMESPIQGRELAALNARLKGAILASKRPVAKQPAKPATRAPTHEIRKADGYAPIENEDDVPF